MADRITDLIKRQSPSSLSEVMSALNQSSANNMVGRQGASFGEVLNQMKAAKLNEAETIQRGQLNQKRMALQERQVKVQEGNLELNKLKKHSNVWGKAFDSLGSNKAALATYRAMGESQDEFDPNESDPLKARMAVLEHAEKAGVLDDKEKTSVMEEKINLYEEMGYDHDTAVKAASGAIVTSRHPMTGEVQLVDKLSGSIIPMKGAAPRPAPEKTEKAPEPDIDYAAGTGPSGFWGSIANTISGAVGGGLVAEDAEKATQALTNLQIRTQTTMQAAVPGRPSKYLLEELKKVSVDPASLIQGDARAKERLMQTREMLVQEIDRMDTEILAHPQEYQKSEISKTRGNRSQLSSILTTYDKVLSSFEKGEEGSGPKVGTVEDGYRFKGGDPGDPKNWEKAK